MYSTEFQSETVAGGFHTILLGRVARLRNLDEGAIKIIINAQPTASGGSMIIEMEDNGPGFDYTSRLPGEVPPDTQFSGRGISWCQSYAIQSAMKLPGTGLKLRFRDYD